MSKEEKPIRMELFKKRKVYLNNEALDELMRDAEKTRLKLQANNYNYRGELCKMWTYKGVAHYLGITYEHLTELRKHKYPFRDEHVATLVNAFGCTASFVIGESKNKTLLDKYQASIEENNKFLMRSVNMFELAGLKVSPHGEDFMDEVFGLTLYYPDPDFVINGKHLTEDQFKNLARSAQDLVRTHIEGALELLGSNKEETDGNDQEK